MFDEWLLRMVASLDSVKESSEVPFDVVKGGVVGRIDSWSSRPTNFSFLLSILCVL